MAKENKIKGLGGWLILVQIGFWLTLAIFLFQFFLLENVFELVLNILYFSLVAYTLFLFYSRAKNFKIFAIITLWASPVIALLGIIILAFSFDLTSAEFGAIFGEMTPPIISAIIWTSYFLKSRRVKNTFVN